MFFNDSDGDFKLTAEEGKAGLKSTTVALLYTVLVAVLIITSAHAVMIVVETSSEVALTGLIGFFLNVVRVAFPIVTEAAASVSVLGTISNAWRGSQKYVAFGIDLVWLLFAAANMVTMFAIERGQVLQGWQTGWINYGLPLSALVAGSLAYALKAVDPDRKRLAEMTAADEKVKMLRFAATRDAMLSDTMKAIEKKRAWIGIVRQMKDAGYTEKDIRYMLAAAPDLLFDGDSNGTPDLFESGGSAVRPGNRTESPESSFSPIPLVGEDALPENYSTKMRQNPSGAGFGYSGPAIKGERYLLKTHNLSGPGYTYRDSLDEIVAICGKYPELMHEIYEWRKDHYELVETIEIAASSPDPSPQSRWQEIANAASRLTGVGFARQDEGNGIAERPTIRGHKPE